VLNTRDTDVLAVEGTSAGEPAALNVTLCTVDPKVQVTLPDAAMSTVDGEKVLKSVVETLALSGYGNAVTVMAAVPCTVPDVARMLALPAATPVTRPLALTVATPVALDVQVSAAAKGLPFWSFGAAVSCSVEPATTVLPPLIAMDVSTSGDAVTVTVIVACALTLPEDAVMIAVPAPTPVTRPAALTVATLAALDVHAIVAAIAPPFWSFGAAVSCSVEPAATVLPPLMVIDVSTSGAVTVTVVCVLTLPEDAVIVAVPAATPVTVPAALTVATLGEPDTQAMVAAIALPFWSLGVAVSCSVAPTATEGPPETAIDVSAGVTAGGVGEVG